MSTAAGLGTKGMPSDNRRQEILSAALREFAERGFAGVSMASVAARAGVSKALVYQHFVSKDQFYAECLAAVGEPLLERLDREMGSDAEPFAVPANALHGIFDTLGPDRTAWRIIHDPSVPDTGVSGRMTRAYRDRISGYATAGVRRFLHALGDDDERDVDALARIWTAAVDAIMAWAREHPEESAEDLTLRFTGLIDTVFSIGSARQLANNRPPR
ncbi:TetR/AcrR family transcriptional regulator [Nocardia aurantiaca]|uniref:TetR family transcriptional regulator n=1 Tax=Nocardia aurantiaca TaxID=2675850 RepID=A0A6I3L8Y2_9NOCA|nr:TetR/AcrR family transcriptional regulator [Nocardia aurantiaca]MTE16319.1 TetR family transcriptional regulator [Nocardia aurantiaca]